MAVPTLVAHPDLHALTKAGRMDFFFEGAGRYQTQGVKAEAVLFVTAPLTEGRTINLKWKGKVFPLVFRASPSEPNEFPIGDGGSDYVDHLVELLRGYQPLRQDFVITRYDPTQLPAVQLVARKPGALYNLDIPNPPVGNPITIGNGVFGADAILREKYSIYAQVYLQKGGTTGEDLDEDYESIWESPLETDEAGAANFNVGSIIHDYLRPDWPTWSFLNPSGGDNSHRKYYVCYGEAWGFPLKVGQLAQDIVRYAYLGGADYKNRSGSGYQLNRFDSSFDENKALRFGSQTRYVLPDEPQFLSFINQRPVDLTGLKLVCTLTYSDDTTDALDDIYAPQTLPVGSKICFAVGPTQLDLATIAGSKVVKEYSIKLVLDDEDWSISYRYILNANYQPYTRYFVYLNSLGAVETLTTYGKGSRELSIFSEQAERYLPAHYNVQDGQFADYNVSTQQQIEVATGFYPQSVTQTWTDFYRSPYKFRLIGDGVLPIQLVAKSIQDAKDGDTLFAQKFTYVYANKDDFYTGQEADEGDPVPPLNFKMMGGTVVINTPPPPTNNIDTTVPDFLRDITDQLWLAIQTAANRPNPLTLGFLTQLTGNLLYRRKDQPVDYLTDLANAPTPQQLLEQISALAPNLRFRLGLPISARQLDTEFSTEFPPNEFNQ